MNEERPEQEEIEWCVRRKLQEHGVSSALVFVQREKVIINSVVAIPEEARKAVSDECAGFGLEPCFGVN